MGKENKDDEPNQNQSFDGSEKRHKEAELVS